MPEDGRGLSADEVEQAQLPLLPGQRGEFLPQRKLPQPNGLVTEFEQIPNQPTDAPEMLPFQRIAPPSADDRTESSARTKEERGPMTR